MSIEKTIVDLVGIERLIKAVHEVQQLSEISLDQTYLAFNRHRYGCIKFHYDGKKFKADYTDGAGWTETRFKTFADLENNLKELDFLVAPLNLLSKEVELAQLRDGLQITPTNTLKVIQEQIKAQEDAVSLRMESEYKTRDYWQGQKDSFEIVHHIIRNTTQIV